MLVGKPGVAEAPPAGEEETDIGYETPQSRLRPTVGSKASLSNQTKASPMSYRKGQDVTYDYLGPYKNIMDGLLAFRRQMDRASSEGVIRLILSEFHGSPASSFDIVSWNRGTGLEWNQKIQNDPQYADIVSQISNPPVMAQQFDKFKGSLSQMLNRINNPDLP